MYIAAKIHNQALGKVVECPDEDFAKKIIKDWAEEQFQRPLNEDEEKSLENELEIYNDEDPDNLYTFSIGITERWA
ncbi:MAG: hypothetical protein M0R32_02620 [Candidatus Cloacimonetes bacterium]|jgi:predicted transcriptional regulator YdeE|nr:hypothetical protein [Candidatus Cloacimonadota bacterium]